MRGGIPLELSVAGGDGDAPVEEASVEVGVTTPECAVVAPLVDPLPEEVEELAYEAGGEGGVEAGGEGVEVPDDVGDDTA